MQGHGIGRLARICPPYQLTGWYGGQILASLPHMEAEFYSQAVIECTVAAVACLIDMIIGIVGEWLCQLPPIDGPENPKIKEAAQRQRYAAAATKSSHVQSSC